MPRPRFWVGPNNLRGFHYGLTWQERRNLVLSQLENSGFGWWIVIVAGLGFLTDAYDIFAINTVVPMLGTVYWGGDVPPRYQLSMNVATLLGTVIGQVCFGVLADVYGRRKMYGLELLVTILASLSFASASTGVYNSMSMVAWLIFWRLVMGIGIGADYPLSAVITAEFSPTKYRGRMIAAVFFCQSLGQMFATLTAFAATAGLRRYVRGIPQGDCSTHSLNQKSQDCARTVDQVWRLVAGLGAVPAALAILSRLTIPESIYWVLDVKNDSTEAYKTRNYWPETSSSADDAAGDDTSIQRDDAASIAASGLSPVQAILQADGSGLGVHSRTISPHSPDFISRIQVDNQNGLAVENDHAQGGPGNPTESYEDPQPQEQSLYDFRIFLFGDQKGSKKGNWTDLFATSINWALFDFSFFILGVNSSRLIPYMFRANNASAYQRLFNNGWQTLIATCIGAVLGGAIAIKIMNNFSRKKIQMWAFLVLAALFILLGVLYVTLLDKNASAVIVAVYVICQLVFNIGPNPTTFILPAEAFPTRYRCTCHGISAASGKLGSVLGQIAVAKLMDDYDVVAKSKRVDDYDKRPGYLMISFCVVMVAGALVSHSITPETCDIWGKSRNLEDLGHGIERRKELIREEEALVGEARRMTKR